MALEDQERALLHLVYDAGTRDAFLRAPDDALRAFGLTDEERADFIGLNAFGLRVDARDRALLVLARLVASFPLSSSALSSFEGGLDALRSLAGPQHFELPGPARTAAFGVHLRDALIARAAREPELPTLRALAEWEAGMAMATAGLRAAAIAGDAALEGAPLPEQPPAGWIDAPLALAPFLVVTTLPASLAELARVLCPCPPDELYARLTKAPLPRRRLTEMSGEPRLVLGRAVLVVATRCEAVVTQEVMEVSPGFGFFVPHIDGERTAALLLASFARSGAPSRTVEPVRDGLWQMLRPRMLHLAP